MTIQDLGSLGELAAAVATLATLFYLATQIRANTVALKSQSRRASVANVISTANVIGPNKEAASVYRRGLVEFESLDADEQTQFLFLMGSIIAESDANFTDMELGIISREESEFLLSTSLRLLATSGGRAYWKIFAGSSSLGFQRYVESELEGDAK